MWKLQVSVQSLVLVLSLSQGVCFLHSAWLVWQTESKKSALITICLRSYAVHIRAGCSLVSCLKCLWDGKWRCHSIPENLLPCLIVCMFNSCLFLYLLLQLKRKKSKLTKYLIESMCERPLIRIAWVLGFLVTLTQKLTLLWDCVCGQAGFLEWIASTGTVWVSILTGGFSVSFFVQRRLKYSETYCMAAVGLVGMAHTDLVGCEICLQVSAKMFFCSAVSMFVRLCESL